MKIELQLIDAHEEERVQFYVRQMNDSVQQAMQLLTAQDYSRLLGKVDGQFVKLAHEEILYIEAVERKVFAYTKGQTYEVDYKLYELEEQLTASDFLRISKAMLLNFAHIYSFQPKLSGNLEVSLMNGEKVMVSRRYVPNLKRRLGMKEGRS